MHIDNLQAAVNLTRELDYWRTRRDELAKMYPLSIAGKNLYFCHKDDGQNHSLSNEHDADIRATLKDWLAGKIRGVKAQLDSLGVHAVDDDDHDHDALAMAKASDMTAAKALHRAVGILSERNRQNEAQSGAPASIADQEMVAYLQAMIDQRGCVDAEGVDDGRLTTLIDTIIRG